MSNLPTHYPSSKGDIEIATMGHSHLKNAYDKWVREHDIRTDAVAMAMAAVLQGQIQANERLFAEQRAELEAEGVSVDVYLGGPQFSAFNADDFPIDGTAAKTEEMAWAKAWTALRGIHEPYDEAREMSK